MKKIILLTLTAILFATTAQASVISFGDTSNYWGHKDNFNGVKFKSWYPSQDKKDVNDIPDILGGNVDVVNHDVKSININYTTNGKNVFWGYFSNVWYNQMRFGDMFIDTEAGSGSWDYVIRATYDRYGYVNGAKLYDIRNLENGYGDNIYHESQYVWRYNGIPRYNHPVYYSKTLTERELVGPLSFTGYSTELENGVATASWVFDKSADLNLSGHVLIGLTTNCANDALLEVVSLPTPEPATFALLAIGLLAILGYTRFQKQS